MTGCYLTTLPRMFMRSTADFDPFWEESYLIPRDTMQPPKELARQIWPELDSWVEGYRRSPEVSTDLATGTFLELMKWLRSVILQDAAFLKEAFPAHPVWKEPVFNSHEFAAFALQVRNACTVAEEDTWYTSVRKAVPAVAAAIRDVGSNQAAAAATTLVQHQEVITYMQQILRGQAETSFALETLVVATSISPGRTRQTHQFDLHGMPAFSAHGRQMAPGDAGRPTVHAALQAQLQPKLAAVSQPPDEPAASAVERPLDLKTSYKLPRSVKTVVDLLQLWRHGMSGMPAVDSLERDWGTRWRPASENNFFLTRKKLIDEVVRRCLITGLSEDVIASEIDRERGQDSLGKLFKVTQKTNKEQLDMAT